MTPITEVFRLTDSNGDVLKAPSRLASIPYDGILTIEVTAARCDGNNIALLTIQTPDGETPIDGQAILGSWPAPAATTGVDQQFSIHDDTKMTWQFLATMGGHFIIQTNDTGEPEVTIIATLTPLEE